jgi:7-carboxy-7-deazaguanine synthase
VLKVNEIFYSIQGESGYAGLPCVFIRLTGCNLRCAYCDTTHAYNEGEDLSIFAILERIKSHDCLLVEITGGEPLLQRDTPGLATALLQEGYQVLVETNGSKDIDGLPEGTVCIMDIKCPGSGETDRMDWDNLNRLKMGDQVKFVLMDERDYLWARDCLSRIPEGVDVFLSPAHGKLDPALLAGWMLKDHVRGRLHLQLHKLLWPDEERGV